MLTRNEEVKQVLSGRAEVVPAAAAETHSAPYFIRSTRDQPDGSSTHGFLPTYLKLLSNGCPSLLNHYIPLSQNQEPKSSPVSRKLVSQSSNSPLWLLPNWELSQTVDMVPKHPSQSLLHRVWTQAKYEINTFHSVIQIDSTCTWPKTAGKQYFIK